MFQDRPSRNRLRWIALGPVVLLAAFLMLNLVTPFRLIQRGLWTPGPGGTLPFAGLVLDALLLAAPLAIVMVMAAWLTAPAGKVLTVRITAAVLASICGAILVTPTLAAHWHASLILGFGALAAVVTAVILVRYERLQAAATDEAAATWNDDGAEEADSR